MLRYCLLAALLIALTACSTAPTPTPTVTAAPVPQSTATPTTTATPVPQSTATSIPTVTVTPAPTTALTVESTLTPESKNGFIARGNGMLMLRVRQDQFSPFQIKNTTVELNPAMPDADKQLEVATLKAFASAFGLDPNQDAESLRAQFAQMMKDGKQFKLKASDKVNEKGVFTSLKVPQGGFTDRVVNPLAGLGITVVPSNNTRLPLPLLIVWRDETGADAGGISMIFGVTNAGQVVAQCNMDKAFINRARSAFTGCVSMVIGYMAMRNTTFTNDKNNPTIPVGSLSEAYRSSYIDIFGSAMWGPKSKSPFK